jgi:hypothetical protein
MARDGMNAVEISEYMRGKGYEDGTSPGNIAKIVKDTLHNIRTNSVQLIEDVRTMHLTQLDKMLVAANKIANGRARAVIRMQAMDRILKIQEQKARVLGLNQEPEKKVKEQRDVIVRIYDGLGPPPPIEMELQDAISSGDETPLLEGDVDTIPVFRVVDAPVHDSPGD